MHVAARKKITTCKGTLVVLVDSVDGGGEGEYHVGDDCTDNTGTVERLLLVTILRGEKRCQELPYSGH